MCIIEPVRHPADRFSREVTRCRRPAGTALMGDRE